MSAVKANVYVVGAALVIALMLCAWGLGGSGDEGFAASTAGVAFAAFAVGAFARNWWTVPAVFVAWFCGWMLAGELDPDSYVWATAYFAPGVALFVAIGVGAGRRLRSSAARVP